MPDTESALRRPSMHEQPPPSRSLFRLAGTAMVVLFLLGFVLSANTVGIQSTSGVTLKDTPVGLVPRADTPREAVQAQLGPPVCPRLQSRISPFGPVLLTEDTSFKRLLKSLEQERASDSVAHPPSRFPLPPLQPPLRLPLVQHGASPHASCPMATLFARPPPSSPSLC